MQGDDRQGASADQTHPKQMSSLVLAAQAGDRATVQRELARGVDVHAQNDAALFWAAANGDGDMVQTLLAAGANVHAGDRYYGRDKALVAAVIDGRTAVVRLLLHAGADPHALPRSKLERAKAKGHWDTVAVMEQALQAQLSPPLLPRADEPRQA